MKDGDRNRPVTLVAFIQQSCSEIARGNPPTVAQEVTVVEAFLQVTEAAGTRRRPGWDGAPAATASRRSRAAARVTRRRDGRQRSRVACLVHGAEREVDGAGRRLERP